MRNFTFILCLLLMGALANAQKPVVTPVWDHSVAGTADWSTGIPIGGEVPSWMGSTTERGMAYYDGNLYIVSRKVNPPVLVVLDAATGDSVNTIPIDTTIVRGGTYPVNDISITPSGKILLGNLATDTHSHPFKVYMMEDDGAGGYTTSTLVEWMSQDTIDGQEQPTHRIGDGFAFFGDVSMDEEGYIMVGDANTEAVEPIVFKWDVVAGEADSIPEKIVLQEVYPAPTDENPPKLGITPRIFPLDTLHFWADGHSTYPALYNMQGELISTFSGEFAPVQAGISGVNFFSFQNNDFILAPATSHAPTGDSPAAQFELFLIPEAGAEEADSIAVFPERGLGANTNASYAAPSAVDVQQDTVMMFIMSPNNGIAAFALTMEEDTTIVAEGRWNFSTEDFNVLDTLRKDTTINDLTIWANVEYMVAIEEDTVTYDGMEFTHHLRLDSISSFDDDGLPVGGVLAFDVSPDDVITVIAKSNSDQASELNLLAGHADSLLTTFTLSNEINSYEYVYSGAAGTLFLYASAFDADLYVIDVDTVATGINPVAEQLDVRIYPNPATDKIFIKVNKPTQVAIYNLAGSMVKSKFIESENDFMNISDLQSGMYIIKSQLTNEFTRKLLVK